MGTISKICYYNILLKNQPSSIIFKLLQYNKNILMYIRKYLIFPTPFKRNRINSDYVLNNYSLFFLNKYFFVSEAHFQTKALPITGSPIPNNTYNLSISSNAEVISQFCNITSKDTNIDINKKEKI